MTPIRSALLAQLGSQPFDVLIIGGGIVGAGIARDAAMRGLTVALIEQRDFAGGTSSKTSKLIHGGLRYLEHGHLRLVAESLRERRTLRAIAPSLVHPVPIVLPSYAGDSRAPWKIRFGLLLYDLLAWQGRLQPSRVVSARRALALEPGLAVDGLRAAGVYADCQMDDARLCLANILQAAGFGAVCVNYVRLLTLLKANQRICGGVAEDALTGRTYGIQAKVVVNAAGPWADRIRGLSEPAAPPRLSPTKGIHLIVPRVARHALYAQARGGRLCFVLPWGGDYSLIGTTESSVDGDLDALAATSDEVGYLLDALKRLLPESGITTDRIVATFAGARPLLAFSGASTGASREHRMEVDRWGLVSVLGGKYTTYRAMAQQAVDLLVTQGRWRADRCLTGQVSVLEATAPVMRSHWEEVTRSLDPELLARLLIRYGTSAAQLFQLMAQDPRLRERLCPHHDVTGAEIAHAFQHELACTVTDVLARRTRIAWSGCQGLDALSTVGGLCQRYTRVSAAVLEHQLEEYQRFLAAGLAFRAGSAVSGSWMDSR